MQVSVYYQSVVFLILAAVALFASRFEPRPDWQALRTIYRHPPSKPQWMLRLRWHPRLPK